MPALMVNGSLVAETNPAACASKLYVPAWLSMMPENVARQVLSVGCDAVPLNDRASRVTPLDCSVTTTPAWLTGLPALSCS